MDACFKSGAPQHLVDYMSSVYKLDYTQEPPYTKLLKMFARGRDPIKSLEWMKSPVSRKVSATTILGGGEWVDGGW